MTVFSYRIYNRVYVQIYQDIIKKEHFDYEYSSLDKLYPYFRYNLSLLNLYERNCTIQKDTISAIRAGHKILNQPVKKEGSKTLRIKGDILRFLEMSKHRGKEYDCILKQKN